jgi:hypothetical protein
MTDIQRIEDQLRRSFAGNAWQGPAVRQLLADVTAEKAAARPLSNAHSIWEIVLHGMIQHDLYHAGLRLCLRALQTMAVWPGLRSRLSHPQGL